MGLFGVLAALNFSQKINFWLEATSYRPFLPKFRVVTADNSCTEADMTRDTELAVDQLKSVQELASAEITALGELIDEIRDIATPFSGLIIERTLKVSGIERKAGFHHEVQKTLIISETTVGISTVSGKPPTLTKIILPKAA